MSRDESLLSWISGIKRKELTRVAEWICDPSVIRQTERFEFTDLTTVDHEVRTELTSDLWPLKKPQVTKSREQKAKKEKGLVVLGFMRRGIPLQHTEVRLFRGGNEYQLTRLKSEDTEHLALALLDNVWTQCGQDELKSRALLEEEKQLRVMLEPTIPRPFEMPDNRPFEQFDGNQRYASRFWKEFLGIGNRNVNADWLLLHSRFKIRESEIANELFRNPRQGDDKWSVERALLSKLSARLAFSYIAAAWVPPEACGDDGDDVDGPTELRFKFQERVLSPSEQRRRVRALQRRGKKAWERTLTKAGATKGGVDTAAVEEELRTEEARIRSIPETYLGLLDPALDDPDDHGRMTDSFEASPDNDTQKLVSELAAGSSKFCGRTLHRFRGSIHRWKGGASSFRRYFKDNSGGIVAKLAWLALMVWLALNAWYTLAFTMPGQHSWPKLELNSNDNTAWPEGIVFGFFLLLLLALIGVTMKIAGAVLRSIVAPETRVQEGAKAVVTWMGLILLTGLCALGIGGIALLLTGTVSSRALIEISSDPAIGLVFLVVATGLIGRRISTRLSISRRKTVVVPTWNSGKTAPIHEVVTPKEFSVWQGILVRPSNRGRSWKTRPAVELGRKASFWWQDPSDRGHVPAFVPGRPHMMIMELRARLSKDLTLFGSLLCVLAATLLISPAFVQLFDPDLWNRLQNAGADMVVTILLLLPTAGGALLIRPGEDPIAANLLRSDRVAVAVGAVLMSALGAGSILMVGWPEPENLPNAFWAAWLVFGSISLCFGFALLRGYRHVRDVNEPQPASRQGAVSESRRNPLDIPAPLPSVSRMWGRLFARRTLLRLAPRRGVRKVVPLYDLLLPAEGSRIYTPSAPTIMCLVRREEDDGTNDEFLSRTGNALNDILELLDPGPRQPQCPPLLEPILGTNDIGWVASRSLSIIEPLDEVTTLPIQGSTPPLEDRERERLLLHLLRLQQANSRPNSTRPFGNGGGICLREVPARIFDHLRDENFGEIGKYFSDQGGETTVFQLGNNRSLLERANEVARDPNPQNYASDERRAAQRLIEALDRASLDFDGLILLNPGDLTSEPQKGSSGTVSEFEPLRLLEGWLSQEAARRARKAGVGVGAHPWPSSLESPLAGESDFWLGTLRTGTLLSLRLPLLLESWRFSAVLKPIRELVFDHGIRTIPVALVNLSKAQGPSPSCELQPEERKLFEWIEGIPRVYSRIFVRAGFPSKAEATQPTLPAKPLEVLIPDKEIRESFRSQAGADEYVKETWRTVTIPSWWNGSKEERKFKIVYIAGNVGAGKTTLALKLRQKFSAVEDARIGAPPKAGQRWEHISPYERHNIFFQLLNLDEPRRMDAEEHNYALFGDRHEVRRELELLMQQTFLIEVAARITDANQKRREKDGILVEYWPEMSVEVMGRTALGANSSEHRKLKNRLDHWRSRFGPSAGLPSLPEPFIVMPTEGIDRLIERNAKRKVERRNEKVDSKFLREVEAAIRQLLMAGYGVPLEFQVLQQGRFGGPLLLRYSMSPPQADPGEWRNIQPGPAGHSPGPLNFYEQYSQRLVLIPGAGAHGAELFTRESRGWDSRCEPPLQYKWPSGVSQQGSGGVVPSPNVRSQFGTVEEFIVVIDENSAFSGGLSRNLSEYLK